MLSRLALCAISLYQKFISPYKGYRCAYSVQHGGPGCSGFAKQRIKEAGLIHALPDIRERLRDCRQAAKNKSCKCCSNQNQKTTSADMTASVVDLGMEGAEAVMATASKLKTRTSDGPADAACHTMNDCSPLVRCDQCGGCDGCGGCDIGSCS